MNVASDLSEPEFEAIRAVVTQTRRGRLFLEEYVRRRQVDDAARRLVRQLLDECGREAPAGPRSVKLGGLERRFAALVELGEDEPFVRRVG